MGSTSIVKREGQRAEMGRLKPWLMVFFLIVLVASLCLPAGLGKVALAKEKTYELLFASYIGPQAAQMRGMESWAKEVEKRTNGRVSVKFFYQGALLGARDILRGVADGRAHLGYVANAYHPAELPLSSVVGIPFVTSNAEGQMKTFYELYQKNEAFRNEWERLGVHVLFFQPVSANILGTKEPVNSFEWLKGKRIRGLGYINQVLKMVRANPIAIPAPEIYEALQRGTIDGYSGFAFEVVTALKLHEVAPHVTGTGMGNYVFAATPITKSLWDKMPPDIKKALTDVSREYNDNIGSILGTVEDQVCKEILARGGTVSVLPEQEVQKLKDTVGDKITKAWVKQASESGAPAQAFLKEYMDTLAKYEAEAKYIPGVRRCSTKP